MRILHRRNKRLLTLLALELVVVTMVGLTMQHASRPAISGTGPYTVYGYITDSTGTPVDGADVAVTIDKIPTTLHCTTASDGYYQVEFSESEWDIGNNIQVIAVFGGQETETGVCNDIGLSQIDVQFTFEIPEFGSVMGSTVVIAALAAVAIVFVWKRPR